MAVFELLKGKLQCIFHYMAIMAFSNNNNNSPLIARMVHFAERLVKNFK